MEKLEQMQEAESTYFDESKKLLAIINISLENLKSDITVDKVESFVGKITAFKRLSQMYDYKYCVFFAENMSHLINMVQREKIEFNDNLQNMLLYYFNNIKRLIDKRLPPDAKYIQSFF